MVSLACYSCSKDKDFINHAYMPPTLVKGIIVIVGTAALDALKLITQGNNGIVSFS